MTGAPDVHVLDVRFGSRAGAVACGLIRGTGGVVLVDPGPTSCLPDLRAALAGHGLSLADVRALLLTHIHLDHAGATGSIVRAHSGVQVFVHALGVRHLIEPSKLLQSAARIWGDRMDQLWGEVAQVPTERVHALDGGEQLEIAGRRILVAYTPGHAIHHVSYFDAASRVAFTGDVAGMVVGTARFVVPPTPPPDINVEEWEESVARIRAWRPRELFITHFGLIDDPDAHLDTLVSRLRRVSELVRASLAAGDTNAERLAWFRRALAVDLRSVLGEEHAREIERDVMLDESWHGLVRYWTRKLAEPV